MRLSALLVGLLLVAFSGSAAAMSFPKLHNYPKWSNDNPFATTPIPTYVHESGGAHVPEALNALSWWEEGGNGKLAYEPRFGLVKSAEQALLVIQFTGSLRNTDHPYASVWNDPRGGDQVIVEVLNARAGERPEPMQVTANIAHAIGHALGLEDSTDPEDVMAWKTQASALQYLPKTKFEMYMPYALVAVGLVSLVAVGNFMHGRAKARKRGDPWQEMITPEQAARWRGLGATPPRDDSPPPQTLLRQAGDPDQEPSPQGGAEGRAP